ncbi:MAG TPA: glycosyltransferase WbuB [bacterium]|nr:glycosyltransferase WbuB [bacterium]
MQSSLRIAMMVYSFYESDTRVRRDAEALVRAGHRVDVICLKQDGPLGDQKQLNGVRLVKIMGRAYNEMNPFDYLWRLFRFFFHSMVILNRIHVRNRYHVVHVHSVPDFQIFAAWLPRMTGSKLILDIHDLVPEFYARKFNVTMDHIIVRGLLKVEKASCCFAHHVITVTDIWKKKLERSVPAHRCMVMMNVPDTTLFNPERFKPIRSGRFTLVYPGNLAEHFGVDIALEAVAMLKEKIPSILFQIVGDGSQLSYLRQKAEELALNSHVRFTGHSIPLESVPQWMRNADVGLVPKKGGMFADEALSTKLMEFAAMELPVVVSETTASKRYFDDQMVRFFRPEDPDDMARAIYELYRSPSLRRAQIRNAKQFFRFHRWERYKSNYLRLIDTLVGRGRQVTR